MSGGSDTTTTQSSIPSWVQPYAQSYMQHASDVANTPYQAYGGQRVAGLNGTQQAGIGAITNRAINGSPVMNTAAGTLQSTAAGDFMGSGNPYMQQMIDASSQDVLRNFNHSVMPGIDAVEARGGSFGNSGVAQTRQDAMHDLTGQLANQSAGLRFQGYNTERNNQMQALQMAPQYANQDYVDANQLMQAGNQMQGTQQAGLDAAYQDWQKQQQYPRDQVALLGNSLGFNFGQNSTQQGPTGSALGQGLGGALAAYGAYQMGQQPTVKP